MKNNLLLLLFLCGSLPVFSQTQDEIDSIQKLFGTRDYTWVQEENNIFKMRKRWTKKWGLYSWNQPGLELLKADYDSVSFMEDMEPFSIIKNEGKYARYLLPFEVVDAADQLHFDYEALELKAQGYQHYLLAKKDGKWGLIDWFDETLIVPYEFEKPEDVPLMELDGWYKELTLTMRANLGVDWVKQDYNNGDGVCIARNASTKLWGMYQHLSDSTVTLIPAQYDSIYFYKWNGLVTPVFKNGKVGFYTSPWSYEQGEESVPCIYDDYEFVIKEEGGTRYLAVKKDGKWAWLDWLNNQEKSSWYEGSRKDLPYPYYIQPRWQE